MPKFLDYFAAIGIKKAPPQKLHAVFDGDYLRFIVEFEFEIVHAVAHRFQAQFCRLLVRNEQYHIVHITQIMLYPHIFFDKPVDSVKIEKREALAGLIAHRQAFPRRKVVAVYYDVKQPSYIFVGNYGVQFLF